MLPPLSEIKKKFHRLQAMQRKGRHAKKNEIAEMDEHVCLNCRTVFKGDFCPSCGQSGKTKRLDFAETANTLLGIYYNFDKGILHTLIDLFYRPGYMIRDYIKGHRNEYVKPIQLLFLMTTIVLFLQMFINGEQNNWLVVMLEQVRKELPNNPFLHKIIDIIISTMSSMAIRTLADAFLGVVPMWYVFRNTHMGKLTNLAETFYMMVYVASAKMMFSIIGIPLQLLASIGSGQPSFDSNMGMTTSFMLVVWIMHEFYQLGWRKCIRRMVLYYLLYGLLLVTIVTIILTVLISLGIGGDMFNGKFDIQS